MIPASISMIMNSQETRPADRVERGAGALAHQHDKTGRKDYTYSK